MPMMYDLSIGVATTPATQTTTVLWQASMLTTTAAGKPSAYITAVWAGVGGNAMTTAGGGYLVGSNWQTNGATTTATTPNKKNQYSAASQFGYAQNFKGAGALGTGSQTMRIYVNFAQTGGPGFWMAANPDAMVQVLNGGTTLGGYLDFSSATASATENLEGNWEWAEQ
jgi:hypothetical protein